MAKRFKKRGYKSRGYSSYKPRKSSRSSRSFGKRRSSAVQRVILQIQQPAANPVTSPGVPGFVGVAQDNRGPRKAKF